MPRINPFQLVTSRSVHAVKRATVSVGVRPIVPMMTTIARTTTGTNSLSSLLPSPFRSASSAFPSPVGRGGGILGLTNLLIGSRRPTPTTLALGSAGSPRFVSYGSEYQPSQRIRKRRHGFLARIKSRNGRKTIARRRAKGKAKLSH